MKSKVTYLFLLSLLLVVMLASCEIISEKPIDARYVEAYDALETDYEYKYDMWKGDFRLMPNVKSVHHDASYQVLYERTWSDGTVDTTWITVSKEEYEKVLQEIGEGK